MHSRLDPIFKTQIRQAETLDTRKGIKRHDPDIEKDKGKNKNQQDDDLDPWEDSTTVSTRALRRFLEQLILDSSDNLPTSKPNEDINISKPNPEQHQKPESNTAQSQRAAHAAKADQNPYKTTHREEDVGQGAIPAIDLSPDEIRTINKLITDLSNLTKNNIEHLTLIKSTSFLQSLVNAVEGKKGS